MWQGGRQGFLWIQVLNSQTFNAQDEYPFERLRFKGFFAREMKFPGQPEVGRAWRGRKLLSHSMQQSAAKREHVVVTAGQHF